MYSKYINRRATFRIRTCWCGVYPREELIKGITDLLDLPDHIKPVAIVAVGHPAEKREVKEWYKEDRVHLERW